MEMVISNHFPWQRFGNHHPIEKNIFFIRGWPPGSKIHKMTLPKGAKKFPQIHRLQISWVFRLHDGIMQIPVMSFQMFLIPVMGGVDWTHRKAPLGTNYTPEDLTAGTQ